jgi:shikimate dehydrogenase
MKNAGELKVDHQTIWFVGVRTQGSAALSAFPGWMGVLREDIRLQGVDLPLDTDAQGYRDLLRRLRSRSDVVGVVITGHKARLFESAGSELDSLDRFARLCREVSVVRRDGGQLVGCAVEPRSVKATLARMLEPGHWGATGGELLIFGAGGTAAALLACLYDPLTAPRDVPGVVHLIDIDAARAKALQESVLTWRTGVSVRVPHPSLATETLIALPASSLIVNATGLGKDQPGSPVPLPAPWPNRAIVWELNYRGQLPMLTDARAATRRRSLEVYDGWTLFIQGWSEALGTILRHNLNAAQQGAFERIALSVRG